MGPLGWLAPGRHGGRVNLGRTGWHGWLASLAGWADTRLRLVHPFSVTTRHDHLNTAIIHLYPSLRNIPTRDLVSSSGLSTSTSSVAYPSLHVGIALCF